MNFEFATAGRIVFGNGALSQVAPAAAGFGNRAFLVTGRNPARARPLIDLLEAEGVSCETFSLSGEPSVDTARQATKAAVNSCCELVIGFGGGSVIDLAKAVAAPPTISDDFALAEMATTALNMLDMMYTQSEIPTPIVSEKHSP